MTKADIVQAIYSQLGGFSKKEAADLVELVFDSMKETLGRGERIKVSGFGNFVLRDKRPRQGRNPKTGDPMLITGRRVLSFKPSNILKHGLNPTRGMAADANGESRVLATAGASAAVPSNGAQPIIEATLAPRTGAEAERRSEP